MVKIKSKTGDIIAIPLPAKLGFAFAMHINLVEMHNDLAEYPTIFRIYNYRSNSLNINIEQLIKQDLILCPHLIAGIVPKLRKKEWEIISNVKCNPNDLIIPEYKSFEPIYEINPYKATDWFYYKNADIRTKTKTTYDKVKHLENLGAVGSEFISTKIAMAFLISENKKLDEYFELKEYFQKAFYEEVLSMPLYYKQPIEIRGKALM